MTNQFDDVVVLVRLRWTQMLLQQLQRFVHQKRKKDKKAIADLVFKRIMDRKNFVSYKVEVEDKQEIKGSKSIQKMKRIGCHVKSKRVRVEQIDHQRAFTIHPLMTHKANHQSKTIQ